MHYRPLGNTGLEVSEVSFGTWAIGGDWGSVSEADAIAGLQRALEHGVNLFDTAAVSGAGRAESLLGRVLAGRDDVLVATKFGRAGDFPAPATYSRESVRTFCEASLRRLGRDRIDVYQVHCPPTEVIERGEVFEHM